MLALLLGRPAHQTTRTLSGPAPATIRVETHRQPSRVKHCFRSHEHDRGDYVEHVVYHRVECPGLPAGVAVFVAEGYDAQEDEDAEWVREQVPHNAHADHASA